jgi:hypothetical protein
VNTSAVRWLAWRWLRRRWVAVLPLALLVAAGSAATMVAASAAHRTATAYGDYLDRAEVGDVVLNPSTVTIVADELIRGHPSVARATSHSGLSTTNDDGQPRTRRELDSYGADQLVLVQGSADGEFTEMNRPAVHAGRMPTGTNEAALTVDTVAATGLGVGDVIPLAFWETGLATEFFADDLDAYLAEVVEPLGVEQVDDRHYVRPFSSELPQG